MKTDENERGNRRAEKDGKENEMMVVEMTTAQMHVI